MKHDESLENRKRKIADRLSCLPRKILQLHGKENTVEFVLHELSHSDCFDLQRIAYVVDNPDFNCLKGVAGYDKSEQYNGEGDIWEKPDEFTKHMNDSVYNKMVRGFTKESCLKKGQKTEDFVKEAAKDLGFKDPKFYSWGMKYDNEGILIYEKHDDDTCDCNYLLEGLCMIGFCPIF